MRYVGNTCPGCGEVFKEDDDVVVCPECATAQHRECYNKKGECVNAHLHSDTFQWKPEKGVSQQSNSTLINQNKDKKTFECPSCGNKCDPDKGYCEKCGAKFVVFGVNLAKELQKEQNKIDAEKAGTEPVQQGEIPTYEPPFKLGVGEGFENRDEESDSEAPAQTVPDAGQIQQNIINALTGDNIKTTDDGRQKLRFNGPYRADDEIEGVSTNAVGSFVRNEGLRYIEKFRKLAMKAMSFNWGAFIFAPYWFFYRRLFRPGAVFMTLKLIVSIFTTYFSYDVLAAAMSKMDGSAADAMTDEALFNTVQQILLQKSGPIMACMFALVVIHLVAGFIGDRLYKKYVFDNVRIMETKPNMKEAAIHTAKYGGVSIVMGLGSYFVYQLLSYAVGMFFA